MAFLYYSPVTINTGQASGTQTNFPMLVSYTDTRFKSIANGGHVNNANGFDIRPYSDANLTSALTYELERYNASTGEVVMWVKGASVVDGLVTYLAYGNSALSTDGSSGSGTFSNSFADVYHLKDGTNLNVADSTGTLNGTNHGATAGAGQIDGGGAFASASSQYISTVTTTWTAVTFSAWLNATTLPAAYNAVIYRNSANSDANGFLIKSNGKVAWVLVATTQFFLDGTGSHTLSTGTWYLVHLTYDSTQGLIGYVNGASDVTAAANGAANMTPPVVEIGRDDINSRYWNGSIDEVRYASVARSAGWCLTEYNNQSAPGTFATLGTEVSTSPFAGLYKI